jgi:hypothetical protein
MLDHCGVKRTWYVVEPAGMSMVRTVTPGFGRSGDPAGSGGSVGRRTGWAVPKDRLAVVTRSTCIVWPLSDRVACFPFVVTVAFCFVLFFPFHVRNWSRLRRIRSSRSAHRVHPPLQSCRSTCDLILDDDLSARVDQPQTTADVSESNGQHPISLECKRRRLRSEYSRGVILRA